MKKIPLTKGKFALVDDEDFEYLNQWKWCAWIGDGRSYAVRNAGKDQKRGMFERMHRVILRLKKGEIPDHIDGNGLNNQRSNLRIATHSQNAMNTRKRSGCSSQYKGVSYDKVRSQWMCMVRGKYVGRFNSEKEAAQAYNVHAQKIFGEFASLNPV
jgi:hypothetical protein